MTHVIAHLIATNFYGGPEKQIVEHLKRLDGVAFKGVVASFLEGGENEILAKAADENLAYFAIPMHGALDFKAQRRLEDFLQDQQVSLLCTHGYKAAVMGWWAARKENMPPVLAFSRGYTAENRKVAFYEWLDRQALKRAAGIVAVSAGQKKKLAQLGVERDATWVVHNAVVVSPLDRSRDAEVKREVCSLFQVPEGAQIVVAAGRLSPEKGHRYLVEAIGLLAEKLNGAVFLFCGDGPCLDSLVAQAARCGVSSNCRFVGFRRDMNMILRAMDLMVLPSLTEGLPNVILEAFSWAKPVVATRVGGVPELVVHDENGYLVEAEQPDQLAEAISKSLLLPEKMKAMGQRGYERVRTEFSFEKQAETLQGIYKIVLGENQ